MSSAIIKALNVIEEQAQRIAELEADVKYWKYNSEELSKYNARLGADNEQLRADKEDLERTIEEAIDFLRNDAYRTRVINALMILEAER